MTATAGGASSSCGCTCASNWVDPTPWSGGGGPVASIQFEDTACFSFTGGTESNIKIITGHVRMLAWIGGIRDIRYPLFFKYGISLLA